MAIGYATGDIFESGADALVNPVNCVGVMGAGLALQFKRRFDGNFLFYAKACREHAVLPGQVLVYETGDMAPRFIVNFPTKRHWRDASRMEDIESGLVALKAATRRHAVQSVAIPALGAGLGGLAWNEVRRRIEAAFAGFPVNVLLYGPRVVARAA